MNIPFFHWYQHISTKYHTSRFNQPTTGTTRRICGLMGPVFCLSRVTRSKTFWHFGAKNTTDLSPDMPRCWKFDLWQLRSFWLEFSWLFPQHLLISPSEAVDRPKTMDMEAKLKGWHGSTKPPLSKTCPGTCRFPTPYTPLENLLCGSWWGQQSLKDKCFLQHCFSKENQVCDQLVPQFHFFVSRAFWGMSLKFIESRKVAKVVMWQRWSSLFCKRTWV